MTNVDVVRSAFDAADRQDKADLFACLAPNVQWHMLGWFADRAMVRHGREAVWAYSQTMHEVLGGLVNELSEPMEVGDQVVVRIHTRGRGKQGAPDVDVSYTGVFLVRAGKIISGENFEDHEEALTEAALRA